MSVSRKIAVMAGLFLAACTGPQSVAKVPLNGRLAETGGYFTRIDGGITVVSEFKDISGKTAVCGVWAKSPKLHPWVRTSPEMLLLPSSAVYLGEQRLFTNIQYFTEVPPQKSYQGLTADCALTDVPWQAGYAQQVPNVRIPDQVVYAEIDDENLAGFTIDFRQSGPHATYP